MKKAVSVLIAVLIVLLFASCNKALEEGDSAPEAQSQDAVFYKNESTKIFNDFAAQLPDFNFANSVENYDESISFKFSVKSSSDEFADYVDALKTAGFTGGTEGAPVSGEGYYKATNADRYMVEAVLENGISLTVTVTRP